MKVRAVTLFKDLKEGVVRKKGDTFIISKERFKEINSTQHGKLVDEVEEEQEEVEEAEKEKPEKK